jgi:protein phosphatase
MNETLCPHCHSPNRPGAKFCATCGHRLTVAPPDALDEAPTRPSNLSDYETSLLDDLETARVNRSLDLRVGRRTDPGRVRELNEDSLLTLEFIWSNKSVSRPAGLFVVADGMGGHEGGEIASGMLVRAVARRAADEWLPRMALPDDAPVDHGEWLVGAIQGSNEEIYEWAHGAGYEMGTTIVAALLVGDRGHIAHVGDSRAYRINTAGIERLTTDHSLVESLVVSNQISREEARDHPQANVIYRTIGDRRQVMIDLQPVQLAPDDQLLLCSDGLSSALTDEALHRLVMDATSSQAACDALIDAANRAGGEDNITAIVIKPESLS